MNERIRELYQQAHMVREYPLDDPMRGGNPPTVYWGDDRSAEKFAELLIQECAQVGRSIGGIDVSDAIKKRFGVE